ncbi:MAG: SRPBCC domain-containing protein [Burkholderiales bacterium]|jgi:hypothetical protein|nr:SRPBCC domain-containing protein [Burkholderiales bacterium]
MRRTEIHSEIGIDAPPARVWQVLTDFPGHARWNPFLREIKGAPRAGERLAVTVDLPGRPRLVFRTRVVSADPAGELTWTSRYGMPGLLDSEHSFVIAPQGDGDRSLLIQHENFAGLLLPAFDESVQAEVQRAFGAMNAALKREAEAALVAA